MVIFPLAPDQTKLHTTQYSSVQEMSIELSKSWNLQATKTFNSFSRLRLKIQLLAYVNTIRCIYESVHQVTWMMTVHTDEMGNRA